MNFKGSFYQGFAEQIDKMFITLQTLRNAKYKNIFKGLFVQSTLITTNGQCLFVLNLLDCLSNEIKQGF